MVADAVLYEGYVLYPYTRSSSKNGTRSRFQFGVLLPPPWLNARGAPPPTVAGSNESFFQQTECLVAGAPDMAFHVRVRFLQLQRRTVEREGHRGPAEVDELVVDGARYLPFDEAVERELDVLVNREDLVGGGCQLPFVVPGGEELEELSSRDGRHIGRLRRRRAPLRATVALQISGPAGPFGLSRLRIRTENTASWDDVDAPREAALTGSLLATHTFMAPTAGRFLSLLDPPSWAAEAAAECRNVHTFPVLAGGGDGDLVLSSPIILYDHPRAAPESRAAFYDSTEMDELLSLRMLTLSEGERQEVRATDARGAALLEQVESLPSEALAGLHGAIRDWHPAGWERGSGEARGGPFRPLGGDEMAPDGAGMTVGSQVRLQPRHGTDAQDMFLAGRTATVRSVLHDIDGECFLAVAVEGDPRAEIDAGPGQLRHFRLDEVEPLPAPCEADQ